jgi:hypothetical protein
MDLGKVLLGRVSVRSAIEVDVEPFTWLQLSFAGGSSYELTVTFAGWIGTEIKANGATFPGGTKHGGYGARGFHTSVEHAAR